MVFAMSQQTLLGATMGSDHGVGHLPTCGQHSGISHARRWLFEVGVLFFRAATKEANTRISPGSRRGTGKTVGSIISLSIFFGAYRSKLQGGPVLANFARWLHDEGGRTIEPFTTAHRCKDFRRGCKTSAGTVIARIWVFTFVMALACGSLDVKFVKILDVTNL